MPVYQIPEQLIFPHPSLAEEDGLLGIGGDLSVERILLAYQNGIFPWYEEGQDILWYAPNPRMVLFPYEFKVSKSFNQILKHHNYKITKNTSFEDVITNCKRVKRPGQSGTWITKDLLNSFIELNKMGKAHSVEVWKEEELVGGLYGLQLGKIFFGESMFAKESNASKIALHHLCSSFEIELVDCQIYTDHLASLGAREIPFNDFLELLNLHAITN